MSLAVRSYTTVHFVHLPLFCRCCVGIDVFLNYYLEKDEKIQFQRLAISAGNLRDLENRPEQPRSFVILTLQRADKSKKGTMKRKVALETMKLHKF